MTVFKKLLLLTIIISIPVQAKNQCRLSIKNLKGKEIALSVEVVSTPQDRNRGLMFRKKLTPGHGMLFVFSSERYLSFWMKNTYIPLSIAYVDSRGYINEIHDMEPHNTDPVLSRKKAQYALEVNRGWFMRNNITTGARINLSGCISK